MRTAVVFVAFSVCVLTAACGSAPGGQDIPSSAVPTTFGEATNAPVGSCSQGYLPLPDPKCTPGALNPDVRQDTIHQTICKSGWTSTIRPPASYTDELKIQQIKEYGYSDTNPHDYEEDHFLAAFAVLRFDQQPVPHMANHRATNDLVPTPRL